MKISIIGYNYTPRKEEISVYGFETFREHNRTLEVPNLASDVWGTEATLTEGMSSTEIPLLAQESVRQKADAVRILSILQIHDKFKHPVDAEWPLLDEMGEERAKVRDRAFREAIDTLKAHELINRPLRGQSTRPLSISITDRGRSFPTGLEPVPPIEVFEDDEH